MRMRSQFYSVSILSALFILVVIILYLSTFQGERNVIVQQCVNRRTDNTGTSDEGRREGPLSDVRKDLIPKDPKDTESKKEGVYDAGGGYQNNVTPDKYLIYRCKQRGCGGMADRLRGMVNVYLLSVLMGRKFGIIHSTPCPLSDYLQPNKVNWLVDEKSFEGKSTESHNFIDKKKLPNNDIASFFKSDVVYIVSNADMTDSIRRQRAVPTILPWFNKHTTADIYKYVLDLLFKPSQQMEEELKQFKDKVGNRKLVCAHFRMGKNPSMPYDLVRNPSNVNDLWKFLSKYDSDDHAFFVASDSDDVRKAAKEKFPNRALETAGKLIHVDKIKDDASCSGYQKVMLEHAILTKCDVLVLTESGFGRTAAFLRGHSDDLYCLQNTGVFACSRHILPEIFPGANNKDAWEPILKY